MSRHPLSKAILLATVVLSLAGCASGKVVDKYYKRTDGNKYPALVIRNDATNTKDTVNPSMEEFRRCSVGDHWPECGRGR